MDVCHYEYKTGTNKAPKEMKTPKYQPLKLKQSFFKRKALQQKKKNFSIDS